MPRRRTKSVKGEVSNTHRYCIYCKANRDRRGFDKHQAACKTIWKLQQQRQRPQLFAEHGAEETEAETVNFMLPGAHEVKFQLTIHCTGLMEFLKKDCNNAVDIIDAANQEYAPTTFETCKF
jgi:hypothetical protein